MSAQPLSAEDRLEIMHVIASYSRLLDDRDLDTWIALWQPDASIESMSGLATGHEALRAWATRLFETRKVGFDPSQLVHFIGMPVIHGDSERVTSQTYTIIFDYDDAGTLRVPLVGRYDDVLSRHEGQWLFEHRVINGVLSAPDRVPDPVPTK
jgi:hypothetical protein